MAGRNPLSTNLKHLAIQADYVDVGDVVSNFFHEMTAPCLETLSFTMDAVSTAFQPWTPFAPFSFVLPVHCEHFHWSAHDFNARRYDGPSGCNAYVENFDVSLSGYKTRTETEVMLTVLARVITSQGKSTGQGFLVNLETLALLAVRIFGLERCHILIQ